MENLIITTYTKNEFQEMIQQAIAEYEKKKNVGNDLNKNFQHCKAAQILGSKHSNSQEIKQQQGDSKLQQMVVASPTCDSGLPKY
ncbi:MAG: hypothetical protein IPH20_14590 [Bacteroidales bacterium]|nr:hypothetical protein [Bacteroidales bacterium]